ncbi:tRNA pseudouridine synthase [Chloropicon primus]|uniref:tRNA pseudouridine(55) synthase n=2 Tax=Chloropicon primus TaxID=1764295 RepID=A0A5B8MKB7_9CHLO|nr:tRNA pseudouridine synthase [Chloropicon primus]UPR00290.1 tRNA pseudouridine synthase [Chloropicon primus]|eukprot:QDZ21078.1 tRNA pseudouridine synthase [Chloropicon primus]
MASIEGVLQRRRQHLTRTGEDLAHVKEVLKTLLRHEVCPRCALRFVGCNVEDLVKPISVREVQRWCSAGKEEEEGEEEGTSWGGDGFVCALCFGLLQLDTGSSFDAIACKVSRSSHKLGALDSQDLSVDCTSAGDSYERLLSSAIAAVEETGFKCQATDFTLKFSIPMTMLLRDISLVRWLAEKYREDNLSFDHLISTDYYTLKRVCKALLTQKVGLALGSKAAQDADPGSGDLGLELQLGAPEVEGEEKESQQRMVALALKDGYSKKRKRGVRKEDYGLSSPTAVFKSAVALAAGEFRQAFTVTPDSEAWRVTKPGSIQLNYFRHPIYVAGRYIKKARDLSQSAWIVTGNVRVGESSVEEVIQNLLGALAKADEWKMIAAGREDMDVRMLGNGRPFVMEIKNCVAKSLRLEKVLDEEFSSPFLRGKVELRDVCSTTKRALKLLHEGAEEKRKTYSALVWSARALRAPDFDKVNGLVDVVAKQKTPLRVMHRRAGMVRDKTVYKMRMEAIPGNDHFAMLELTTQAGTYIKEFVTGDMGRTTPSLATILGWQTDILSLDVMGVEMAFDVPKL